MEFLLAHFCQTVEYHVSNSKALMENLPEQAVKLWYKKSLVTDFFQQILVSKHISATMDSFGKALQWLGGNVQMLRKSDSCLNTTGMSSPTFKRCSSYRSVRETDDKKDRSSYMDGDTKLNNIVIEHKDTLGGTNVVQPKTSECGLALLQLNIGSNLSSEENVKSNSDEQNKPISPFEFKTLIVIPNIPDLPGAKVVEMKPNPAWPVEPPVSLGIVRSSTTRLNKISPPFPGEIEKYEEAVKKPVDLFKQRRLKEKSESFTGIENFRQKRPKPVFKRTNSAALMKVPVKTKGKGCLLAPDNINVRTTKSDSETVQDLYDRYTVPENRLAATQGNNKSLLSVFSSASGKRDSIDRVSANNSRRTSIVSRSSMGKSAQKLQIARLSIASENKSICSELSLRDILPVARTHSRGWSPSDVTNNENIQPFNFNLRDSPEKSRKVNAVLKAFRLGNTDNRSRLSLFSFKSGKRCKRDKMYRKEILGDREAKPTLEKNAQKEKSNITTNSEETSEAEQINTVVKNPKRYMLKKQMSSSEFHLRNAQLELFKNYFIRNENESSCNLGYIQFIVCYFDSSNTLRISGLKGTGILKPPNCSKSARIFAKLKVKSSKCKTLTSKRVTFSHSFEFFEDFDFPNVFNGTTETQHLKITLHRKNSRFSFPKFLGKAYTSLTKYDLYVGRPIWRTLRSKSWKRGKHSVEDGEDHHWQPTNHKEIEHIQSDQNVTVFTPDDQVEYIDSGI